MADIFLELPPPQDQRIIALHAWIATYANGAEGIISADLPGPLGVMHMPLVTSNYAVAKALEPVAMKALRLSKQQAADPAVSVRFVTFKA